MLWYTTKHICLLVNFVSVMLIFWQCLGESAVRQTKQTYFLTKYGEICNPIKQSRSLSPAKLLEKMKTSNLFTSESPLRRIISCRGIEHLRIPPNYAKKLLLIKGFRGIHPISRHETVPFITTVLTLLTSLLQRHVPPNIFTITPFAIKFHHTLTSFP